MRPAAAASACARAGRPRSSATALYQIVVTEIPYQVPKSRLIERIAALLEEKKLPLLADVRDESTETVRLVLEPKTRNVDPAVLMESLFRATELEVRVPLNLNVLDAQGVPRVMTLEGGAAGLSRSSPRACCSAARASALAEIARRSRDPARARSIVYLNLDEVIRIIREDDDPRRA